jgi:hypothetical protein
MVLPPNPPPQQQLQLLLQPPQQVCQPVGIQFYHGQNARIVAANVVGQVDGPPFCDPVDGIQRVPIIFNGIRENVPINNLQFL